ncbi:ribosomal protein S6 kinase delta-1-like isoform X2 [Mytilus trossulus]|uniref:ribosomal protein S6 kinase delta-1-like isoform X2 n=1 Tax=Mytilus trossulus TaxID=6551 RepID=UPI00300414F2
MASRMKRQTSVQDKIWNFNVSDPTLHPNGFTIYKVTMRVFRMSESDKLTEIIIWKRYNDFKELYKGMINLHKALHRRNPFPVFAKPKLFGRFEETVIEERRKSAIDLLVFIGSQPHLYNSKIFEEFLKGGKVKEGVSGKVLKPSKLDIMQSVNPQNNKKKETEPIQPVKHPPDDENSNGNSSQQENGDTDESLEGVWNFPRVPDNISLNSFDDTDDSEAIDAESILSTSLPELDITSFDPLKSDDLGPPTPGLKTSSSWLFAAMDTCAGIDETEEYSKVPLQQDDEDDQPPSLNLDRSDFTQSLPDPSSELDTYTNTSTEPDLSDFDPLKPRTLSSVECGKGDLELSWHSRTSSSSSRTSSVTSSPRHGSKRSPSHRFRSGTNESVSTMDLGGKEDYIYCAADQICLAQECEASSKFELAFSYYKSGVGILLQGVQTDKNKARRDAVRRKTAQYLMKAEDLYNRHLANDTVDEKRWLTADNMLSPSGDLDPTLNLIKAPISEMKNLKVLGTIDKVLLVMDKTSDETYVIKTIHKSSVCSKFYRTIMPLSCPYMVHLHKFYETENTVYLILQHATGGKLWNYIGEYLQYNKSNSSMNVDNIPSPSTNVYSGFNTYTNSAKEKDKVEVENDQIKNVPSDDILGDGPEFDNESSPKQFEENKLSDNISDISDMSDDRTDNNGSDKPDLNRIESMSSEEIIDFNEASKMSEQQEDVFQELLLNSNQTNLENFSINSIESNEGRPRVDSIISDNINIESIPEESEISPTHQLYSHTEEDIVHQPPINNCDQPVNCDSIFNGQQINEKDNSDPVVLHRSVSGSSGVDEEAEAIVQNAKDLLRTVERTLSQTDTEVNKCIYPDSVENKNLSPDKDQLNDSCDTLTDHNEVSIYDVNRSFSDTNSDNESKPCESESKNRSGTVKSSSSDTLSDKTESKKNSRSSTLTDQSRSKPHKLSRMNSKELSRSASFEHELKSPNLTRQRTLSDVFRQLDLAMSSPEQVRLPETCIRQWIAEIVIAVSRLHAEGLICRDLRPDNILLGENGHILLSYFCQISLTDRILNQEADDQFYVAPEVNGIGNYTEVCDWWSVGTLLYELVMCRSLKSSHPGGITPHTQLYLPNTASAEAHGLLHQLLCYNPKERLGSGINGSEDIKAHPFFSGINWNQLEKLT